MCQSSLEYNSILEVEIRDPFTLHVISYLTDTSHWSWVGLDLIVGKYFLIFMGDQLVSQVLTVSRGRPVVSVGADGDKGEYESWGPRPPDTNHCPWSQVTWWCSPSLSHQMSAPQDNPQPSNNKEFYHHICKLIGTRFITNNLCSHGQCQIILSAQASASAKVYSV